MSNEIIENIKKAIEGYADTHEWEEIGKVVEVGDGILKISGLQNAQAQEVLTVETSGEPASAKASARQIRAVALNLEEDSVGALVLGDANEIKSGDTVKRTKQLLSINVGEQLLGRVVDPLGNPIDGKGPLFSEKDKPQFNLLENDAPNVINREGVNYPLHTGIKAIDSMIPIGRGQRELIIGDRQTGKTAIVLDTIINQLKEPKESRPICIYVAVGQKESKVAKIVETLKEQGAFEHTIVVSASASSPASFWYLAPFAGAAIGEYFRDKGKDALVIYDDLSKHAWAYRQISLLLRRPPGREAYPGDVFYLHSRLLERAAKLSKEKGGGSLTALPIIETQLGDVTAYIPTNVISITDGQIYLESDLFYQGTRPAVNVGLSVSRVGSSAQTKAMKKVAGKLRLELAQFRELQTFVQFASDVDEATKQRINKGKIITEILKQPDLAPIPFENQVLVLYAVLNGYFDKFAPESIQELEKKFLDYLNNLHKGLLEKIQKERAISDELEGEIKSVIEKFVTSNQ
ncbi:MAG: F0F1 ATP synthase subunit alpha [Candidatus Staskawiczbacteria bacterium]|nr:F0F1 ATP synthase subunit alpha [Candidatus Staskawiczbacteria bacterium]